jgi:hypothetical protein
VVRVPFARIAEAQSPQLVQDKNQAPRACAPKFREASFDDHSQIAALLSKYGLAQKSFAEWQHFWVNNPAYLEFRRELPIGWVLETADDRIVGYLGNIPLFYEFEGQRRLACVAHAWTVDAQYRTYSLQLLDRYFSQRTVELFLNATVGPVAAEPFAVFQSLPVPVGRWDRSSFWITNYRGFVAGWLTMKGWAFAKPASYLFSIASFAKQALSFRMPGDAWSDLRLQECHEFDNRFDQFWDALRNSNPRVLLGVRSRDTLGWHFKYALAKKEAWIVASGDSSAINAYAVFLRYDNSAYGLKRMRLVDFQTLKATPAALIPMVRWALEKCRREQIDSLECIGFHPDKQNLITAIAPYQRKLPSWLYFYKTRDKSLADKLKDPAVWDPSQFDGDASL